MKENLSGFLKVFLPFSLLTFGIQFILVDYIYQAETYYSTMAVYAFHILATFLIYYFLLFVHSNFEEKTGFAFMACSLLKMLAAVLFLLPLMLSDTEAMLPDIAAFFIPYFLFLFFETYYAVRLINTK